MENMSGKCEQMQSLKTCILQLLDEKKLKKTENLYLDFESAEKANQL